jgi:hypothetical protein
MGSDRPIRYSVTTLLLVLVVGSISLTAKSLGVGTRTAVGDGLHPWYEIKVDASNSQNMIICGTKWDAAHNSAFGFVYASIDGGVTWQTVLEDRSTTWVTEHSCAFGPNHMAYFVSEASKVIDGTLRHELGTTRLFVSPDGGQHWEETAKTGWADYSTSAVNATSGRLYTFFNSWNTAERNEKWGSSIGLLVFSPNGKEIDGPFFDSRMRSLDYTGVFPSSAIALKDGVVVALYYGTRRSSFDSVADLGIIRADQTPAPAVETTVISHPILASGRSCDTPNDNSLAYDREHNRLFLVYLDGCGDRRRMMLTLSDDEGSTWTNSVVLAESQNSTRRAYSPSIAVGKKGAVGLLWEEGATRQSGHWLFSYIRDLGLIQPPVELSPCEEKYEVSNDSLRTSLSQGKSLAAQGQNGRFGSAIMLSVINQRSAVWRVGGLTAAGDNILAVWPSRNGDGKHLYAEAIGPPGVTPNVESPTASTASDLDVTGKTAILYGGEQRFDSSTGTLKVYLVLANRGDEQIKTPIKLKAEDIKSEVGRISILNASNGSTGAGAIWDISSAVTGDQIPPGTSSNPFCLSFHLEILPQSRSRPEGDDELFMVRMRVLASRSAPSEDEQRSKN